MFRRGRPKGDAPTGADAEVDRIVSLRMMRATRRTEKLLRRIDALEKRVKELESRVDEAEPRAGRFRRPLEEPAEEPAEGAGARVVASQMLESGIPPGDVAAHLQEAFDLDDPERVVEDVAAGKQ